MKLWISLRLLADLSDFGEFQTVISFVDSSNSLQMLSCTRSIQVEISQDEALSPTWPKPQR